MSSSTTYSLGFISHRLVTIHPFSYPRTDDKRAKNGFTA